MCVRIKPNLTRTSESPTGIEPVLTFRLPVKCSNQLSYAESDGERRL